MGRGVECVSAQIYVSAAIACFILDRLGKDLANATQVVAWRKLWCIQDFSYEL